mmetsp:Transcript_20149/g.63265  ORF Transcript_20149/g.63265 Transcript_20149/m.63265 type:complete len:253 (+) Transcript_20149:359-1117(+)
MLMTDLCTLPDSVSLKVTLRLWGPGATPSSAAALEDHDSKRTRGCSNVDLLGRDDPLAARMDGRGAARASQDAHAGFCKSSWVQVALAVAGATGAGAGARAGSSADAGSRGTASTVAAGPPVPSPASGTAGPGGVSAAAAANHGLRGGAGPRAATKVAATLRGVPGVGARLCCPSPGEEGHGANGGGANAGTSKRHEEAVDRLVRDACGELVPGPNLGVVNSGSLAGTAGPGESTYLDGAGDSGGGTAGALG